MRYRLLEWIMGLCLCGPLAGWCAAPSKTATGPAPVPAFSALLLDQTGSLDAEAGQALEQRLKAIQASNRAQVAILIAREPEGEPLADYALRVAQTWKLGHAGRDDGLLILVVPGSSAARIEVGYGLEGAIPDVRAGPWIAEFLPALKERQLAEGLNQLLDRIEAALPAAAAPAGEPVTDTILDRHPEWKLPFVLTIFSPFAIFPLFFGRWGALASAPLFAAFMGAAAWLVWGSRGAAYGIAVVAGVLPLLWSLNGREGSDRSLPVWLRVAKALGNLAAVLIFFSIITLFVGVGLSAMADMVWPAPVFAGLLATGLAVFLFPGKPALYLMVALRNALYFVFVLVIVWLALMEFMPNPATVAFAVATGFTACVELSFYLEGRERAQKAAGQTGTRWSVWLVGLALLMALPFAAILLVQSVLGPDFQTSLAQATAGGGSLVGVLWLAARTGFFAVIGIGLGGRFGGGGAGGRN